MFASTAAFMLRSLNIPTRIVKGFFVDPQRYDRTTGQTGVIGSDIHVWIEVCLDGRLWVPVETTPGYPAAVYQLNWWQRVALLLHRITIWGMQNPILTSLLVSFLIVSLWNYRRLLDFYRSCVWQLHVWIWPDQVVTASAKLLDQRSQLAGLSRPISLSSSRFSQQLWDRIMRPKTSESREQIDRFCKQLNQQLYRPNTPRPRGEDRQRLHRDCRELLKRLKFTALKQLKKQQKVSLHD